MSPEVEGILGIVVLVGLVIVPALAISARIALRPIVEAVVTLKEELAPGPSELPQARRRIAQLESRVERMEDELHRFREEQDFDRRLGASRNDLVEGKESNRPDER